MYKKVELKNGFVGMENEVANYWKKNDIIKKNFAMNEGKRYFEVLGNIYAIEGEAIKEVKKPKVDEKLDCSAYTAFIVDDNNLNIKVAKRLLEQYKFKVESVTNGKDCIYKVKEGMQYDIIFMDHMMPEMDGIETLHVLKKLDGYKLPPIVALTANAITGMKEMYLNEGFDEYLSKPINTNELDRILNKYFNKDAQ